MQRDEPSHEMVEATFLYTALGRQPFLQCSLSVRFQQSSFPVTLGLNGAPLCCHLWVLCLGWFSVTLPTTL